MGMLVDKDNRGFGMRSLRYAVIVVDGVVVGWSEEPGFSDNCETAPTAKPRPSIFLNGFPVRLKRRNRRLRRYSIEASIAEFADRP